VLCLILKMNENINKETKNENWTLEELNLLEQAMKQYPYNENINDRYVNLFKIKLFIGKHL
jgi:recombination DNA repair RAD52 pathway protein